ncbi:MAG: hypothetical protein MK207_04975 [Saprospiraceae bacterium]|nr:hypothetical protein [Saprospiraceae bacterium]
MNLEFEIKDDARFLGLINTDQYNSYIDEHWEFEQLKERIINESNKGHLLFWGTDLPNFWTVRICDQPVAESEFRSFEGKIKVTNSKLHLINYESLTIAAQFEEEALPEEHLAQHHVELQNAVYNVTIRQLFNPEQDEIEDILGFEIVLTKSKTKNSKSLNSFDELVWSEY